MAGWMRRSPPVRLFFSPSAPLVEAQRRPAVAQRAKAGPGRRGKRGNGFGRDGEPGLQAPVYTPLPPSPRRAGATADKRAAGRRLKPPQKRAGRRRPFVFRSGVPCLIPPSRSSPGCGACRPRSREAPPRDTPGVAAARRSGSAGTVPRRPARRRRGPRGA